MRDLGFLPKFLAIPTSKKPEKKRVWFPVKSSFPANIYGDYVMMETAYVASILGC